MSKLNSPDPVESDAAEEAINTVLGAEQAARGAVERAQRQALAIGERARTDARAMAERSERRIRRVVAAFEAELALRLGEIDAQAQQVAVPQALSAEELAALERAVGTLVHELTGAPR